MDRQTSASLILDSISVLIQLLNPYACLRLTRIKFIELLPDVKAASTILGVKSLI
jgi:hypothetical protein